MEHSDNSSHPVDAPKRRAKSKTFKRPSRKVLTIIGAVVLLLAIVLVGTAVYMKLSKPAIDSNPAVADARKQIPELKKAVDKNPKDASARYNLGSAYYAVKDYNAAKGQYEEATKLDAKNPSYFNNLGNTYRDLKDYKKAAETYQKAIAAQPTFINAYANKAFVEEQHLKDNDAALATYNAAIKAITNEPDLIGMMLGKAGLLVRMDRKDDAKKAYEEILAKDANNPAAKASLEALK